MGRLLIRSVAVIAVMGAVATVFARNADSETAHRSALDDRTVASLAGTSPNTIGEISIDAIADASARNAPGGSSETSMMVTDEQKAAIRRQLDLLGLFDGRRASPHGVGLKIGVRLPREKIQLTPVPSQIAQIVPRYGAYEYFLTERGALVIVDPGAYEIVDVIGA